MTQISDPAARYARHIAVKEIGGAGQAALAQARIAIVGMGGLGGACAQYLVAGGVATKNGAIGLIDDDCVSLSNLQRQTLFCEADIGKPKTLCAKTRLAALNSACKISAHPVRLCEDTITLLDDYDIIADASDNFVTRFLINDYVRNRQKTLISAACIGWGGHICVFSANTDTDYRDFVPDMPTEDDDDAICADYGIVGAVAGIVGTLQALEVIKEITGAGDTLAGRVLIYDGLRAQSRIVRLVPNKPQNISQNI